MAHFSRAIKAAALEAPCTSLNRVRHANIQVAGVRQAPSVLCSVQQQGQRSLVVAAAKRSSRRDDDEPIDVDVQAVAAPAPTSPNTASTAGSTAGGASAPAGPAAEAEQAIKETATTAAGAVTDASDVATALVRDAANAASGAVSDAADAATAAVDTAARTASNLASDAADVSSALVGDASAAVRSAADDLRAVATPGGPIDWSAGLGSTPDPRFAGMKVLVVGATGGVGRQVVAALRSKGVPCRALVRDRARAANLLPQPSSSAAAATLSGSSGPVPPEFEIVTGDVYQYATLPAALKGCNAVIVASGANDKADPLGPFNVDYNGNLNLIAAAKAAGVKHFVLVTSIGVDDILNPLNLFWGILFWKKRAEEALQRSGLRHTIVRPGGLKSRLGPRESSAGNIVMGRPGTYGFPPLQRSGAILRSQVADVCVEALVCPAAEGKVVEIIAEQGAPAFTVEQLFEGVSMTLPY